MNPLTSSDWERFSKDLPSFAALNDTAPLGKFSYDDLAMDIDEFNTSPLTPDAPDDAMDNMDILFPETSRNTISVPESKIPPLSYPPFPVPSEKHVPIKSEPDSPSTSASSSHSPVLKHEKRRSTRRKAKESQQPPKKQLKTSDSGKTSAQLFRLRQKERVQDLEAQIQQLEVEQSSVREKALRLREENTRLLSQQTLLRQFIGQALQQAFPTPNNSPHNSFSPVQKVF
jgi:type IV secretory pathway VirB10-like protein